MYALLYTYRGLNGEVNQCSHNVATIQAAMAHLWFQTDFLVATLYKDGQQVGRITVTTKPEAPKDKKARGLYSRWFMDYTPYGNSVPTISIRHPLKDTA